MRRRHRSSLRSFTLMEVLLVVALLALLAGLIMPNFLGQLEGGRLDTSAERMRTLLSLTRSHAAFDGKRYRIRFAREDEIEELGRQPIIEREDDPVEEPEIFVPVDDYWVRGETLQKGVWCAQVRLGKPSLEDDWLTGEISEERAEEEFEDEDPLFPPLLIDPDGTCEWVTFVLTTAEPGTAVEDLDEDEPVVHVIMDGMIGLIWLQRAFYEEELDMLREHNWPPVLRTDFLRRKLLTEEEVIEIKERHIRS